ncbi:DNA polymerase III subunit gamma/tau [Nitratireductor sp. L1-7-SE]|uniref:DNA polymerase III subunit gamma/tau n=1 Tax=Nitratireductor rhodophyticola TaxID=2854036 RepID=A0ABS7RCM8_9HYPH|nr:DNA polymerase III subunit gamma/tau [Nitratireductor rhodophyticola]MBY8917255.1 DNA polymerase III subunit gamma/tau [Nitratireductor rhodophyticola]MBY8920316.1 DNA polymerase III subunit gamma/tau [Nitratireductor rhodophyticola]
MTEAGTKASDRAGGAYRVLARKYRPSDFTGLIGQEPMVRTLTNAFNAGRIAQAWMLTGVRGVGKTTTARILARALNYKTDTIDAPTVDLTVEGEHCRAILEGRHVDVVEMDAASHTGIDDIRDIIDQVRYAPVSARYKVFIIDEVHMLSNQAFNGLLKTLEEPPPHVKFIFATTEIRKVPITILSRCQRFDLRRIDAAMIKADLARIGGLEGVEAEDEALAMIARASEGSMRDAQSIFDQAIAHSSGKVTAQTVRDMLGLADRSRIIGLFEDLMKGDVAAALAEFRAQYDVGADPATVLNDLAEFNHLVTRLRFVPEAAEDAALSEDERTRGLEFSKTLSVRVLSRTWQMLLKGIQEVQSSGRPMAAGEMVLIRIAHAASLPTLDEALKRLDDMPAGAGNGQGQPPAPGGVSPSGNGGGGAMASAVATQHAPVSGGGQTMRLVQPEAAPVAMQTPVVAEEAVPDAVPLKSLEDIARLADAKRDMAFKVLLKRCVRLVSIEPGRLDISLTEDAPKTVMGDLTNRLKEWTGRRWIVSLSSEAGGPTLAEQEEGRRESAIADAKADPAVAAILDRFPGAKIIDIRIPDATDPDAVEETADAIDPVDPDDDDDDDF